MFVLMLVNRVYMSQAFTLTPLLLLTPPEPLPVLQPPFTDVPFIGVALSLSFIL